MSQLLKICNTVQTETPSEDPTGSNVVVTTDGLISHFPLNNDSQAKDWTTGYDGTDYNLTYTDNGAYFNGSNSGIDTLIPQSDLTNSTISLWVNATTLAAWKGIFGLHSGATGFAGFQYNGTTLEFGPGGIALTLSTNVWYHLLVRIDSTAGTVSIYQDNVLQGSVSAGLSPTGYIIIGRAYNSSNRYWHGYISNFRFYNRVLTVEEGTSLYNEGLTPNLPQPITTNLSAFYPLTGTAEDTLSAYNGTEYIISYVNDTERGAVANFDSEESKITVNLMTLSADFTISFFAIVGTLASNVRVFSNSSPRTYLRLRNSGSNIFSLRADSYTSTLPTYTNTGGWQHFVIKREGSLYSFYVDNVFLYSRTDNIIPYYISMLGNDAGDPSNNVVAGPKNLSNVRIYEAALSDDELTVIHQTVRVEHPIDVDDSLVAYYPLDNNTEDNFYNQNDGIWTGTESYDTGVLHNGAVIFNASDSRRISIVEPVGTKSAFSYCAFIYGDTGDDGDYVYLVRNSGRFGISLRYSTNSLANQIHITLNNSSWTQAIAANDMLPTDSYFVTVTWDKTQNSGYPIIYLYNITNDTKEILNTASCTVDSLRNTVSTTDINGITIIAGTYDTWASRRKIVMEEIRVYDKMISEGDTDLIYNNTKAKFGL